MLVGKTANRQDHLKRSLPSTAGTNSTEAQRKIATWTLECVSDFYMSPLGYQGNTPYFLSEMNKLTPSVVHVWDPDDNDVPYVVELGSLMDEDETQVYATCPGFETVLALAATHGNDITKLHEPGYFVMDSSDKDMLLTFLPVGSDVKAAYDIFKTSIDKIFTSASQEYRITLV